MHVDPRWPKVAEVVRAELARIDALVAEPALRGELLALEQEDQAARAAVIANENHDNLARMTASDTATTARLKAVIAKYGWPGFRLVGKDGAKAAWLFVQHSNDLAFQKTCLALMQTAVAAHDASAIDAAYLYDRVAMYEQRPQRYGTQFRDGALYQVEDEANLDNRRAELGMSSMAEYRAQMTEIYGSGAVHGK